MRPTDKHTQEIARRLYEAMPGAPRVEFDHDRGEKLWGEVDENEHYLFCEQVAQEIQRAMCRCPLI